MITLADEIAARQITVEVSRLCQRHRWREVDVVLGLAKFVGHVAAVLDLENDERTFADKMHAFTGVAEDTYRRDLARVKPGP